MRQNKRNFTNGCKLDMFWQTLEVESTFSLLCFIIYGTLGSFSLSQFVNVMCLTPRYDAPFFWWKMSLIFTKNVHKHSNFFLFSHCAVTFCVSPQKWLQGPANGQNEIHKPYLELSCAFKTPILGSEGSGEGFYNLNKNHSNFA